MNAHLAATKELLREMAAEAQELQLAAGGSVTDTVAGWLASQYATAAQERLTDAEGARHWEILRAFVQDWSLLRRGDHYAERLSIERERLSLNKQQVAAVCRSDEEKALSVCLEETKQYPEVIELFKTAFSALKQAHRKNT